MSASPSKMLTAQTAGQQGPPAETKPPPPQLCCAVLCLTQATEAVDLVDMHHLIPAFLNCVCVSVLDSLTAPSQCSRIK